MNSDKVADALATLTVEVEKLQAESGLADYLKWAARFYTYSPSNVLLIRVQRPDATQVAGYHRWLELGRTVRKGEKGILILAPVFRRKDDDEEDQNRQPVTFRATHIFDVGQTNPLPGHENDVREEPEIAVPVLNGEEGGELLATLLSVARAEGLTVDITDALRLTRPDLMGFYVPGERRIWVRPNPPLQQVKTLAHELAHHFGCHDESNPNNESMAEGAAYVVLAAFGLDSGARSVPYICGWDSRQPGAYKAALSGIQRTAKAIIEKAIAMAHPGLQDSPESPSGCGRNASILV